MVATELPWTVLTRKLRVTRCRDDDRKKTPNWLEEAKLRQRVVCVVGEGGPDRPN